PEPEPEPEIKDEPEPILEFDEVSVDIQDEPAEPEEEISIFEAGMNEEETEEDLSIPEETYETAAAPAAASKIDTSIFEENKKMSEEIEFDINDGPATDESSVITQGMTITGDITSEGSLDVIGTIQGNIAIRGKLTISGTINGDSKAGEIFADSAKITGEVCSSGSVKIGQASVILGNVSGTSAVIAGAVKGDIDVHGPVILDTSAIVMGDIKSKSVQINNGAVIEGHCSQCYADVSPTSFFQELKE
ncbi:MAG TPA: cell shape determination protein CcmA, partial [Lachnospiraceae bacterium]|nr:cell shape determination protein CcmA [Lachnospiraceae bacterium]